MKISVKIILAINTIPYSIPNKWNNYLSRAQSLLLFVALKFAWSMDPLLNMELLCNIMIFENKLS